MRKAPASGQVFEECEDPERCLSRSVQLMTQATLLVDVLLKEPGSSQKSPVTRLVDLECCLLKVTTVLMEERIVNILRGIGFNPGRSEGR